MNSKARFLFFLVYSIILFIPSMQSMEKTCSQKISSVFEMQLKENVSSETHIFLFTCCLGVHGFYSHKPQSFWDTLADFSDAVIAFDETLKSFAVWNS